MPGNHNSQAHVVVTSCDAPQRNVASHDKLDACDKLMNQAIFYT